ncbi:hypothetical protein GCM10022197_20530 [Microlunatus spumicola]|uniref:Uncharacterized protein n=1 Tax=Microlunatus spumicola TaxID=81499 RepID=A0ABP6XHH3_9ACTN
MRQVPGGAYEPQDFHVNVKDRYSPRQICRARHQTSVVTADFHVYVKVLGPVGRAREGTRARGERAAH